MDFVPKWKFGQEFLRIKSGKYITQRLDMKIYYMSVGQEDVSQVGQVWRCITCRLDMKMHHIWARHEDKSYIGWTWKCITWWLDMKMHHTWAGHENSSHVGWAWRCITRGLGMKMHHTWAGHEDASHVGWTWRCITCVPGMKMYYMWALHENKIFQKGDYYGYIKALLLISSHTYSLSSLFNSSSQKRQHFWKLSDELKEFSMFALFYSLISRYQQVFGNWHLLSLSWNSLLLSIL